MKKRLIIIILLGLSLIMVDPVLAQVSFGNWDKWDEELIQEYCGSWYWAIPGMLEPREAKDKDGKVLFLFSDLYFFGDQAGKSKAYVLLYSDGSVKKEDWDIPNAKWALCAFPLAKKQKMVKIMAYKMEEESHIFKFFEEWEIPFKDGIAYPEGTKFEKEFKNWVIKINSEYPDWITPKLSIIYPKKKIFILTVVPEMIKDAFKY